MIHLMRCASQMSVRKTPNHINLSRVGLYSGGKDSCFNMMLCQQHGHEVEPRLSEANTETVAVGVASGTFLKYNSKKLTILTVLYFFYYLPYRPAHHDERLLTYLLVFLGETHHFKAEFDNSFCF